MDKREAITIAENYSSVICKRYKNIEKIIMFGSFAKGNNHKDSDIDLAILFKSLASKNDDIIDMQIKLMRSRSDEELMIEPHPFISSEFNDTNPIVNEINKNGIQLLFQ